MPSGKRGRAAGIFLALTLAMGCKPEAPTTTSDSSEVKDAVVTPAQQAQAWDIVKQTQAYLPYTYTADGCWARATYMQLALQSAGIPSDVQYARVPVATVAAGGAPATYPSLVAPTNGQQWAYHVAPSITTESGQSLVLDPGLHANGPVSSGKWINSMVPKDDQNDPQYFPHVYKAPNSGLEGVPTQGELVTAGSMAPIGVENLRQSYGAMDQYLLRANALGQISDEQLGTMRTKLQDATLSLGESAVASSKLSQGMAYPNFDRLESMPFSRQDLQEHANYNTQFDWKNMTKEQLSDPSFDPRQPPQKPGQAQNQQNGPLMPDNNTNAADTSTTTTDATDLSTSTSNTSASGDVNTANSGTSTEPTTVDMTGTTLSTLGSAAQTSVARADLTSQFAVNSSGELSTSAPTNLTSTGASGSTEQSTSSASTNAEGEAGVNPPSQPVQNEDGGN